MDVLLPSRAAVENLSLCRFPTLLKGHVLDAACKYFKASPDMLAGWWRLGVALSAIGLKAEARRAFQTALSLEPR